MVVVGVAMMVEELEVVTVVVEAATVIHWGV
jgi:hypothetical protein